jgi:hypothetical protein
MKALVVAVALALLPLAALAQSPSAAAGAATFGPAEGPVTIADGLVGKGEMVVSYPVQPLHTGVLVGDAKANSKLILPDGAPVFRAPFVETLNNMALASGTVWCGVPTGAAKGWRLLDVGHGLDVLVGMSTLFNPTPYAPDSYSMIEGRIEKPLPTVHERPVTFPAKLRQEITFRGWAHDGARFSARISDDLGRKSFWTSFTAPREADGSVVLPPRDGALRLRPAGDGASIEQMAPAARPHASGDSP